MEQHLIKISYYYCDCYDKLYQIFILNNQITFQVALIIHIKLIFLLLLIAFIVLFLENVDETYQTKLIIFVMFIQFKVYFIFPIVY